MDPHLLQCLFSTLLGSLNQKVQYCYLYCNSKYYHGSSETCLEPYVFRIFFTYCKQLHEDIGVYKIKFFKIPAWQDLRPATYNFIKKRLQHKCFTEKLLRALTKILSLQNAFVTNLEQTSFFLKCDLNINNFVVLLCFLLTQIFSRTQLKLSISFLYGLERSSLYEMTNIFLAFTE